jgi:dGTPase
MLLSELSVEFGESPFSHPYQSCRLVEWIEPLHLQLEVRDGFLCHDGGMQSPIYRPHLGKSEKDHQEELELKKNDPDIKLWPMTLEGCLVKLCDTVAYLVRDVEDAKILKLIEDVPETQLGIGWSHMLAHFKEDLVKHSTGQKEIILSDGCFEALLKLRQFNFETIYFHPKLKVESERIRRAYRTLFTALLLDQQEKKEQSYIWKEFLMGKSEEYLSTTGDVKRVVDYVAGMTDRYFLLTLNSLVTPAMIRL